jgi:predicted  nucleic acid-binding Zn-ribbon protein
MAILRCAFVLSGLLGASALVSANQMYADSAMNPMRRVVNMLKMMQNKVTAEGKKETEMFDKFTCWCKTGGGDLSKSISEGATKIADLESDIKGATARLAQMKSDLSAAQTSKAEATSTLEAATALRNKEAKAYAKESSDFNTNIAAMGKAIAAIENGATGFLQTSAASVLRGLTETADISSTDRDVLTNFLSAGQGEEAGYAPQSGEITGVLTQMLDTMKADLADATAKEKSAKDAYDSQAASLNKQIKTLTSQIETLLVRIGDAGVELVNTKEDLQDTTKCLGEDKVFLGEMQNTCSTKEAEHAATCKTRAEEQLALADTIAMLNDDDSLLLFKKTLPSPALLQMVENSRSMKQQALQVLRQSGGNDYRLKLIQTALTGKGTFDKVLKMIDDMVALLGGEQVDDESKKEYCDSLIDKTEDEMKELDHAIRAWICRSKRRRARSPRSLTTSPLLWKASRTWIRRSLRPLPRGRKSMKTTWTTWRPTTPPRTSSALQRTASKNSTTQNCTRRRRSASSRKRSASR